MDITNIPNSMSPAKAENSTLTAAQLASIKKSAGEFEAMFMSEMVGHMFEGLKTDPMFGGGHGEDMFRSMITQEYGKSIAKSAQGAGLTDQIQRAMIRIQENANKQSQRG